MEDQRGAHSVEVGLGDWLEGDTTVSGAALYHGYEPRSLRVVAGGCWPDAVEAFAPSAEDQRQTPTLEADAPALVEGDLGLLTQMLVNLFENALRHAGPDTRIVVASGRNGVGGPWLSVRDNGPGVPASERQRVFDRFYRLERSRTTPGSGLGLAMAAAAARLHGAEIELRDADPGLEARVWFS
jgi:signal transduction histidine kinase